MQFTVEIRKEIGVCMRIMDLIYPAKCVFCGGILNRRETGACLGCLKSLEKVMEPTCFRCGKPILSNKARLCADCERNKASALTQNVSLWVYNSMTKKAMISFKYDGVTSDAGYYATLICERYAKTFISWGIDVIVPIPIHRRREWFRGYNQAAVLAEEISLRTGIPVSMMLKRTRFTLPLKELDPNERRKNLKEAFLARKELIDRNDHLRVLLIDDIYTTGATLDACSEILKQAGVDRIYSATVCIGSEV